MASNPVTVNLGDMADTADRYVASGRYRSINEVVRAGLRALEREQLSYDEYVRSKVAEALADPRPAIPLEEAMAQVRGAPRKPLT